ncbi:2OG-Fe(II) oxygenase family protein [Caulobacter sp. KR2-114]|uniref:2OG-Fe(II) oxygenase family protein n=1 Tax=Caulobacter sp. KR2-114 TaxID=3400912 RepID=UPI003C01C1F6
MSLRAASSDDVPVVDLSAGAAAVEAAVARACADWGFFHLVGHGLEAGLAARALDKARALFELPAAAKRSLSRSRDNPWGYYDRELTKNRRDKKQIFDVGPDVTAARIDGDVFLGQTPFPAELPAFRQTAAAWFTACEGLCARLLAPIATGLGAAPEALDGAFRGAHTSFLRFNHYPTEDLLAGEAEGEEAEGKDVGEAGLGIHHHTDAGGLTVLLTDGRPGLEVLKAGAWRAVDAAPGGLIVNIGDMVQVWSNDAYAAPLHRVQAMRTHDRLSAAFFFNPAYAAVVAPLPGAGGAARYRGVPWSEFRRRRADGDFADYGAEVQISDYRAS